MSIRRLYESTFIINAALEDPDIEAVVRRVTEYIENHGGQFVEMNKWGRRRLAYPIKKKYNGFYVYMAFESASEVLPLIERFFTLEENVLRHLTLELSEKLREHRKERALISGSTIPAEPMEENVAPVKAPVETEL
ncbi:MAG: 30S ribosomal protein S6 [Ignavibacteria bacterium]|jgi:small subunit ribosomal protein S6|nr:30S ribosomal protein S6 [Ignavibacteria bacterium]